MWFKKLDLEENPFLDRENTKLIGYEDIVDEILYRIAASDVVFIEGENGSGKTAILRRAINNFGGSSKVVYVDCKELTDVNVENLLIGRYGLFGRLFKTLPREMIMLMDDVQSLSKRNCERVKYFYDQNYIKSVVFTGNSFSNTNFTDSLKDRISKVVKIKNLSENDAVEIIASRWENNGVLSDGLIKEIFSRSKSVKEFIKNCDKVCEYAVENNNNQVLSSHINSVLGERKEKMVDEKKPTEKGGKKVGTKPKHKKKKEKGSVREETKKLGNEEIKIIYEDVAEKYY